MSLGPLLETYEVLRKQDVKVSSLVVFHLNRMLTGIKRKIIFRQKFKDPWTAEVIEFIEKQVFYQYFRALRDYHISFGRTTETVRDKKGNPVSYIITFTHFGCLRFHLKEGTNTTPNDIKNFFTKKDKNGNKATVLCTTEKPAVMTYKIKTGACHLKVKYQITNKYGNVCSY